MRIRLPFYFLLFLPILSVCSSDESNKQGMIDDLHIIKSAFEVKYAPVKWKQEYAGWDLEEQIELAKQKIIDSPHVTIKDYQQILRAFFSSMQDFHCNIDFHSTELSGLPFRVQGINNRYFIIWKADFSNVDPQLLKARLGDLSFEVGDEILEFDGKPIYASIEEVQKEEFGENKSETNRLLAERTLTLRLGAAGNKTPKGDARIVVKRKNSGEITSHDVKWIYHDERIPDNMPKRKAGIRTVYPLHKVKEQKNKLEQYPAFNKKMLTPYYARIKKAEIKIKQLLAKDHINMDDRSNDDGYIGSKKGLLPELGKVIWKAADDSPFRAYIFKTAQNKRIGFIRIPHYDGGDQQARQFALIMQEFVKNTDGLIIDQLNNPGGSVFYMYSLLSMLTDKPLLTPMHKITITQEDVAEAVEFLDEAEEDQANGLKPWEGQTLHGMQLDKETYEQMISYFKFIISEWQAGRTFTNPNYIYAIKEIKPHPAIKYRKPIVVLINGLDFSCGDFFPAILQDNKRAKIFGANTAGAGGFVLSSKHYNLFGIANFTLTGSIAERPNGKPIENLGVKPDQAYELTEADLLINYKDYVQKLLEVIPALIR